MHEKPEEFERPDSAEEINERARREMVYLLRSILEEVHNQRQSSQRPVNLVQSVHQLPGPAIDAGKLFLRIEAAIALASPYEDIQL